MPGFFWVPLLGSFEGRFKKNVSIEKYNLIAFIVFRLPPLRVRAEGKAVNLAHG